MPVVEHASSLSLDRPGISKTENHFEQINLGPADWAKSGVCVVSAGHSPRTVVTGNRDPLDVQLSDRFEFFQGPLSENRNQRLICSFNQPRAAR